MKIVIITLLAANVLLKSRGQQVLSKKYTIRLPLLTTIGGRISPFGPVCTAPVELFLNKLNSQSNVLPDYNVVADVTDDECTDAVANKRILNLYAGIDPEVAGHGFSGGATAFTLPQNVTFSPGEAFTPPLVTGGICSPVCKLSARLAKPYGIINMASACTDSVLDDKLKFPNFYRISPSVAHVSQSRIALAQMFNWKKVAILSETFGNTFTDTVFLTKALADNQIQVISEEMFSDDPTESIGRLKRTGARIIFATCTYFSFSCPKIGCAAHQAGLYGPQYVWIFPADADMLTERLPKPPGCTVDMLKEFSLGSLYLGIDSIGAAVPNVVTEMGLTQKQVETYIYSKATSPLIAYQISQLIGARFLCHEAVQNAVFILDRVDRLLKEKRNESLVDLFRNSTRKKELTEMLRRSTLDINISGLWGRVGFAPNSTTAYSPAMFLEQMKVGGERKTVLTHNLVQRRFDFIANVSWSWQTPPLDGAQHVITNLQIPGWMQVLFKFLASTFLLPCFGIVLLAVVMRRNRFIADTFWQINSCVILGCVFLIAAVITYPSDDANAMAMDKFCQLVPVLFLLGNASSIGGLVVKVWTAFRHRKLNGHLRNYPEIQYQSIGAFCFWLGANLVLLLAMYFQHDNKSTMYASIYPDDEEAMLKADVIEDRRWLQCKPLNTMGAVIFGLHALTALSGIIAALLMQQHYNGLVIADLTTTKYCIYAMLPLDGTIFLAYSSVKSFGVNFGALVALSIANSALFCIAFAISGMRLHRKQAMKVSDVGGISNVNTKFSNFFMHSNRPKLLSAHTLRAIGSPTASINNGSNSTKSRSSAYKIQI